MAISFSNIGLAEPSTITKTVGSVIITRGSTAEHQEILVLGDPQSSLGLARVVAAPPASTEFGLIVRIAGGPSSAVDLVFRPAFSSTSADNPVQVSGNSTVFQGGAPWSVAQVAGSTWNVRAQNSSAADLLVTVSGNSTVAPLAGSTWNTRCLQSSAADLQATVTPAAGSTFNVRALNSSAGDFLVTISGNSTVAPLAGSTWNTRTLQSSAADLQMTATPAAGSTWNARVLQSSAADLQATVTPVAGSTWTTRTLNSSRADLLATVYQSSAAEFKTQAWNFDGIGNAVESSTRAVGTNSTMRGISVRAVMPTLLTTASSNVFASTTFTIATSNAATIQYVYAYSITTTNQTPTMIGFYAGSTLVWPLVLAAISSAVSGVNLAVTPPAYLFKGDTGAVLQMKTKGSTGLGYKGGFSYWTE